MPHRKNKSKKRIHNFAPCINEILNGKNASSYHSLMIPVLPNGDVQERRLQMQQAMNRLESIGYSTVAFCHTVYGKPKLSQDEANIAIPDVDLVTTNNDIKKRKSSASSSSIRVLKRLHVVVENLSDVGYYTSSNHLLETYDLISMAPRNDATFQAACATAVAVDILTLDYYCGGRSGLPFYIRTADLETAAARDMTMELWYSPAIVQISHRRALIQAARTLQVASKNIKSGRRLQLLFSAGDANVMKLRSPGDLINLLQTVLLFDSNTSRNALDASRVLETAWRRRLKSSGDSNHNGLVVADIHVEDNDKSALSTKEKKAKISIKAPNPSGQHDSAGSSDEGSFDDDKQKGLGDEGGDDGFITL
jgi:ribonuclease P/MRP protein subunit RPP1